MRGHLEKSSPQRRTFSIRARLLVLALVAITPLVVLRVRQLEANWAERIAAASEVALDLARQGLDRQNAVVAEVRSLLEVVAHTGAASLARAVECGRLLNGIATDVPWIRGLTVVGTDGRINCSTFAGALGADVSDRVYVRRAIEAGEFATSDYMVGRFSGQPTLVAALGIRGPEGRSEGAIVAGVDLQWVGQLATTVARKPGSMVLLVDDLGTVLAAQPAERNWLGRRQADQPLVAAMLATPEGTITTEGPDGTRRIFGFVRLSDTATRLAVGLEEADVLRGLHREIESAYLNLAFLCVLVLFGIWFGGDRLIVRPVRSLARTAARFGQGNLTERASHTAWAAEFAPLAAALDEMAQRLAEREEELHVANTHLEELASQDGLSGLANRRGFDAGLRTEWQRAAQLHRPVGLLMIDIDHFKLFNDRYGHVDGDACLYRVGEVIGIVAAHGGYLAARYGGEEFAVLLPGCDAVSAGAAAERVRQDVATLAIEHAAATLGYVTVSVGVAMLRPGAGQSPQVLVEAADAALYAAKRQGRNLVVAHENAPMSLAS